MRIRKFDGIPRIPVFNLACVNKFERSLALPGTAESVQNKDVLLPQIIKKILPHFGENVLASGKARGWRRAAFWGWLSAGGKLDSTTFTQQVRKCMLKID